MTFSVGPVNPSDYDEVSAVIFLAYRGENTYINAVYPENLTKDGQAKGTQKLRSVAEVTALARFEKVTDTATGKIVGVAIWLVYEREKPAIQQESSTERVFESEDKEFAAALGSAVRAVQAPFWRDNEVPLIDLLVMTVLPEYQCRGVGTLLMKSGMRMIDESGAKCTVISTVEARKLYENSGFVLDSDTTLQVPEKFATRPTVRVLHMIRKRTVSN